MSKHRTDNRRRGRAAVRSLVVGVVAVGAGVVAVPVGLPGYAVGPVLAVGLLALWRGAVRALDHRRAGAEIFMIRERGLINRRAGTARAVPWQEIDEVAIVDRVRALSRLLGHDVVCRVRLTGGEVLRVTGYTENARDLAGTIADQAGRRDSVRTLQRAG
ncbi:hypothetical protein [Streptomyces litchfieldiae]|uniref:PH domain-containing protein n=1 Tax=Streptomyces litchfieldiae TaxID=3075543 RepID=A0ABU2MQV4_9ACTN|nr:hypothetical protein [Streptomyces sp. DSM 44938]MDT0343998.1 hypothetical protein [Streptomyces sp. DSM 44938]